MVTKDYKDWAKKNSKDFTNKFLSDFSGTENPVVIMMAGLPGAGKTEISKNFIENLNFKLPRLDMDEIAEDIPGYRPENASEFREAATLLMNKIMKDIYKDNISFVLDGTFGSPYAIKKRGASIET